MVVLKIHVHGIGAAEFKRNAPVSRHADAPGAFPAAGQLPKPKQRFVMEMLEPVLVQASR